MATVSKSLTVADQGVYTLDLNIIPDGATVTPTNNIQTWLNCAGIWDKTYNNITQVLADGATFNALVQSDNAVKYMVRSTNWASSVTANSTAMTYIGANSNCANKLLNNATWRNAICNSTYFEKVLITRVPTMTSDTTPSGQTIGLNCVTDWYPMYRAFDGDVSTYTSTMSLVSNGADKTGAIGYMFTSSVDIVRLEMLVGDSTNYGFKIQYSDDGNNWGDITNASYKTGATALTHYCIPNNVGKHKYWRVYFNGGGDISSGYYGRTIYSVQFFGRT